MHMKFSKELLEKAKKAENADELLALAKSEGVDLTEEDVAKAFADLHHMGELADEELDNVSGGGCADPSKGCYSSRGEVKFKYEIGAIVWATEGEMSSKGKILSTSIKSQKGKGFNFGDEYYPVYMVGIGLKELSSYREKEFREEDIKLY